MRQVDRGQRGFALVFVLWMSLLIAVVTGALVHEAQNERAAAHSDVEKLQADLIADGAINRAILSFVDPSDPLRWHIDGSLQTVQILGHQVGVRVTSESGKIDLNAAPSSVLAALCTYEGMAPADSSALADHIVAWRSPLPATAIDEASDIYQDAGRTYGPRHGLFRSVGELRLVLGMTDALEAALAPLITVYSGNSAVDRGVAGDTVLQVLAGAGDGLATTQLTARADGNAAGVDRVPSPGEALTISARVENAMQIAGRTAIIRLTPGATLPYQVLAWH